MKLSDERREQAAAWFARQRRVAMSIEERAEFDAWRADPQNLAALNAMHELWGEMVGLKEARLRRAPARQPRRATAIVAASVALAAASLVTFSLVQPLAFAQSERTAIGEQRTKTLPDGSVVNLNVLTRIDYRMAARRRDVRLEDGQALFVVHKDAKRPFFVRAGNYEIRSVGTEFDVRLRDGAAEISVQEGIVLVRAVAGVRAGQVVARLLAGQKLDLPAASSADTTPPPRLETVPVQSIAEWRLRAVSYEDVSVGEVVTDLNRYFPRPIEIADPALARRRVTIRLQVSDREETLRTLSALLAARVSPGDDADVLAPAAS